MSIDKDKEKISIPVLALRGLVIFPNMLLHFDVGRKKSIAALNSAMANNQKIFLVAQKNMVDDNPGLDEMYKIGVVASVKQMLKMPNDSIRVVVEGHYRAKVTEVVQEDPFLTGVVRECPDSVVKEEYQSYQNAFLREVKKQFELYAQLSPKLSPDVLMTVLASEQPGKLADFIASNIMLDIPDKQKILNILNPIKRLETLCAILTNENEVLSLQKEIEEQVHEQMEQNQKEYFLREQMKVISQELGEADNPFDEAEMYNEKIYELKLPEEIEDKFLKETSKLSRMPQGSHEASVIRNYLDNVLELPWNKTTKERLDVKAARKILDSDHYGMEEIKDRIIELLAVRKLAPDINGQIICLVGPPGVGKTSVAKSIAKAIGRKYARISLGGIKDESEIRGHRKTYIGSMPGRIINAVSQAGSKNALILLDEIDKVGDDYKGDPASALLEALDPEQNNNFRDHYIEAPFDLSQVLFITTANTTYTIPEPLLDRMEVIELPSYTHEEKFKISKNHLISKQTKKHGLNGRVFKISDEALRVAIDSYTREAGVRKLERTIATLCRKAAKKIVSGEKKRVIVEPGNIEEFLGPPKYKSDSLADKNEIGLTNGLAWTSVGGELMPIETLIMDGSGRLELTGSLGDIMKESAKAAISYLRSKSDEYGIAKDFYSKKDIHIHVPEGAIPKDGPSAGITIATSLLSALTERPVKRDVAMTGEITLRGKVLPIGGLREKTMAAYRMGVKTVIIPDDNLSDLSKIDPVVLSSIEFVSAKTLDDVIKHAVVSIAPVEHVEKISEALVLLPETTNERQVLAQ